jgi:hypothetical protein
MRVRPYTSPLVAAIAAAVLATTTSAATAQVVYRTGQDVAPAFDGWTEQPDGTFDLWFGYFNRNWDEISHVPVGPDNRFEPGDLDQDQPTAFQPRRNRFVFKINVPADFGEREIAWTLTVNGKTNSAYASLSLATSPTTSCSNTTSGTSATTTRRCARTDGRQSDSKETRGVPSRSVSRSRSAWRPTTTAFRPCIRLRPVWSAGMEPGDYGSRGLSTEDRRIRCHLIHISSRPIRTIATSRRGHRVGSRRRSPPTGGFPSPCPLVRQAHSSYERKRMTEA